MVTMKRLTVVTSLLVSIVVAGLFLGLGNVGIVKATGDVGEVAEETRPFDMGGVAEETRPFDVGVTDLFTPTFFVYLPFAARNFPLLVHVPEGEYLLVEYWTHSVLGANCARECIDFSIYHFDPQSGELTIYPPEPALMLADADIGYVGNGTSLGGVGGGANSSLTNIRQIPLSKGDVTLRDVDEFRGVTVEREGDIITLEPGAAWASGETVESWDWLGAGCVVTSTSYITNYAFQDRDKIISSSE